MSAAGQRALLTGDIERPVEETLAGTGSIRQAAVVTVPHHGSRTSSSTAFIDATQPMVAVVSAAYGNRWALPRPDIVRRWESAGSRVFSTADDGAVVATVCPDGIDSLRLYRRENRRIWRSP